MIIRREIPADIDAIRAVTAAAFAAPHFREPLPDGVEPDEAPLVGKLRADAGWLPALSMVAVVDGAVVGHVVCTRGHVGDAPALGLGPVSVHPDHQRSGVGSALMHAVLGAADALDEPLVVLLGDPAYYHRFGFGLAAEHGIEPPVAEWAPHFQARPLTAHDPSVRGVFTYAAPFNEM